MALKWVQESILSFGGNPADVTVGGQSAGAISACALNVSPLAKGLFKRVIMMSFTCAGLVGPVPRQIGFGASAQVLQQLSNPDLATLQKMPLALLASLPPFPTVDGLFLTEMPLATYSNPLAEVHSLNALLTTTSLDGIPDPPLENVTSESYTATMNMVFGTDFAARVLERYPATTAEDSERSMYTVNRDLCVRCPAIALATSLVQRGGAVSLLEFSYPTYPSVLGENDAIHQADLNMVFGYSVSEGQAHFPFDPPTSKIMMREHGTFVKTGAGTTSGLATYLGVGLNGATVGNSAELFDSCPFWATLNVSDPLTYFAVGTFCIGR